MESAVDNIIRLIFFWPDIILDARMNFFQKVEIAKAHKDEPNEMIVMVASSLCTGFLGSHESDLAGLRKMIDEISDANMPRNPDGTIKKKPVKGYGA